MITSIDVCKYNFNYDIKITKDFNLIIVPLIVGKHNTTHDVLLAEQSYGQ